MAICLGINDDIIKLIKRYDDLKAKRKPETFISSFHTDYMACNLNYSAGQINSSQDKNNYSGLIVDPGKNSISASLTHDNLGSNQNQLKKENSNLIDFNFSSEVVDNSNKENNQNKKVENNKSGGKINDINDLFDAFK